MVAAREEALTALAFLSRGILGCSVEVVHDTVNVRIHTVGSRFKPSANILGFPPAARLDRLADPSF